MPIKVTDQLYRGPQPSWDDLKSIPNLKTVISLEADFDEDFLGGKKDRFQDVECLYLPMSDFWGPSPGLLHTRLNQVLDALKNGSVYVHCLAGKDRTGLVCAAYRMLEQKWTYEQAVAEMYALGFHFWYKLLGWPKVLREL